MAKKKNTYMKKLAYNNAYNRENYRSFSIRYSKENEAELIQWLESQPGVKKYISDLILADMKKKKKAEKKEAEKKASKKETKSETKKTSKKNK